MDLAQKTDLLFKMVTKPDGQEYSYREIEELADGAISSTSIWKVRMGKTQNPSRRTIQALSKAFQVPVSYFFEDVASSEDVAEYREQYRSDKLVKQIALRAHDLDEEGKRTILDMVNYVWRTQNAETQREGRSASA